MLTKRPFLPGSLRLIGAVALLLVVFIVVDIKSALKFIVHSDLILVACAVLLVQVQMLLSAYRWQLTAECLDHPLRYDTALGEYYLATAMNLSLPGGILGDATRVVRTKQNSWAPAVQSVFIERITGQLILWLTVVLAWISVPWLGNIDWLPAYVQPLKFIAGLFIFTSMVIAVVYYYAAEKLRQYLHGFRDALVKSWFTKRLFLLQTVLSLCVVASYLGVFSLSAAAIGHVLDLSVLLLVVPLVLLSMLIPLSIGGWGIREASVVSLWSLIGLPVETGLATSLLYGIVSLVSVVPGALIWLMRNRK